MTGYLLQLQRPDPSMSLREPVDLIQQRS